MDVEGDLVSYAYVLMYLNSAGNSIENFLGETGDGAQRYKINNGAQSIADKLVRTKTNVLHNIRLG